MWRTLARLVLLFFLKRWGVAPDTLAGKAFSNEDRAPEKPDVVHVPQRNNVKVRVWDEDKNLLAEVQVGSEDEDTGV